MRKIKKQLLAITFLLLFYSSISIADDKNSTIVQNFIDAIKSKDQQKISIALNELITNFDAQALLKENWPDHFTLFNFYKISERIKNVKSTYGFTSTNTTEPAVTEPNTTKGLPSNRDYINVKNTPNRIAVRQSNPISNIDAVRNYSNQDQESNQDRIRRRR